MPTSAVTARSTNGAAAFLTLVVIAMLMLSRPGAIAASGGAPGVAVVAGGWGCWALATALMACVTRCAEYRADARAAQLLGSPRPVVAMLQDSELDATTRQARWSICGRAR
jgi:Zn-dependent protease with chaperone function